MSRYLMIITFLLFAVCAKTQISNKKNEEGPGFHSNILTGKINSEILLDQFPSYRIEKDRYNPNPGVIAELSKFDPDVQIYIFLGTWCPDCKREVPRFLKIMELIQKKNIDFSMYALDRSKKDDAGLTAKFNIEYIPTFIILFEDQEMGRIVELPMISLEADLLEILEKIN